MAFSTESSPLNILTWVCEGIVYRQTTFKRFNLSMWGHFLPSDHF